VKRKVLAIALSLALLTSLFAFAAPVSAKNLNSIDFLITLSNRVIPPGDNWQTRELGAPIEVTLPYNGVPTTKSFDFTIKAQSLIDKHGEAIYTYDCSGTFGEGTGILYFEMLYDNFQSMRMVSMTEWKLTFDNEEWEGTIFLNRVVKSDIVSWRSSSSMSSSVNREPVTGHLNVIKGTGDFKNFHFVQGDVNMFGTQTIYGTGFFTPN